MRLDLYQADTARIARTQTGLLDMVRNQRYRIVTEFLMRPMPLSAGEVTGG